MVLLSVTLRSDRAEKWLNYYYRPRACGGEPVTFRITGKTEESSPRMRG